jgi:hypothetical protein
MRANTLGSSQGWVGRIVLCRMGVMNTSNGQRWILFHVNAYLNAFSKPTSKTYFLKRESSSLNVSPRFEILDCGGLT